MTDRPLEGLLVVSIEQIWAGPLAGLELAALGAEVIKVESVYRPDSLPNERARIGAFSQLNRNKRGITLDLRMPEAQELCRRLVAKSDIVVENFLRRTLQGFGLDYPELVKVKPDLIMASTTGYGHTGPYADYKAVGPNLEVMSGLAWHTRFPFDPPTLPGGGAFGDTVSGHFVVLGIMAALLQRELTGKGAYLDLSQYEGMTFFAGEDLIASQLGHDRRGDRGNAHDWMSPHGVYECVGDLQWLAVAVESDEQWRALTTVAGQPWGAHAEWATRPGRMEHRAVIDEAIENWTRTQQRDQLVQALNAAGVPVAAVEGPREIATDPRLWRRRALEMVDITDAAPELGLAAHHGAPWRFEHTDLSLQESPPAGLGRDNDYVFGEILGLSQSERDRLEREGVTGREPLPTYPVALDYPEDHLTPEELVRRGIAVGYDPDFRSRIDAARARLD